MTEYVVNTNQIFYFSCLKYDEYYWSFNNIVILFSDDDTSYKENRSER